MLSERKGVETDAGAKPARVFVVDDDAGIVDDLVDSLLERGYEALGSTDPRDALELVLRDGMDLVLADVVMPQMRGDELLRRIHEQRPEQLVILMTAFGSIEQGVAAIQAGACDFIAKPFSPDVLLVTVERALRERQVMREIVRLRQPLGEASPQLVSRSTPMRRVVDLARRCAASDVTVLVTGESGVGKGVVAAAIHRWSRRGAHPFVNLNCAAIPSALAEAELFGVRRGAYTDAKVDREGLFVRASKGTLFLDEIAELPLELQPKLLHVLEAGYVRSVGSVDEVPVSTRLVAATNAPLEDAVTAGRFRADLYHRLNVVRIEIPPLRARLEDLPALVDHMLPRIAERLGRPIGGVSASAMRWMMSHQWPGNVRELGNTLERAVALAEHDVVRLEDVRPAVAPPGDGEELHAFVQRGAPLAEVEAAYIRKVLEATDFNKVRAAKLLGIDRRTLYRKLAGADEP
jgi:DNA-binding NtrC family response regulator